MLTGTIKKRLDDFHGKSHLYTNSFYLFIFCWTYFIEIIFYENKIPFKNNPFMINLNLLCYWMNYNTIFFGMT